METGTPRWLVSWLFLLYVFICTLVTMDVDKIFLIDSFSYAGPLFDTAVIGHIQESAARVADFYHVRFDILFCHESDCRAVC